MGSEATSDFTPVLRVSRQTGVAEGWFLPGGTPQDWVREVTTWGAPLEAWTWYVLPRSLAHRSASGVLVTGADGPSQPRSRVIPFRRLDSKLFLPADSHLDPIPASAEMDALLHYEAAVFHPIIGLVGFERDEALGIEDLLQPPVERPVNFSWAHPGLPNQDRLYTITPVATPAIELLLEDAGEDIGSFPADELPPTPEETGESGIRAWRSRMKRRFYETIKRLSGPETNKESDVSTGLRHRLESWAEQRLRSLRNEQEKELERLIHLLKSNPDEGLKYALPLYDNQQRGTARPSGKLPPRKPHFDLNQLGGGKPGSPWVVDWQKHYELSRRYREAANRELRLGRHRRAAYIFAELLKDYREAANVLRQGGHFREASVLYLKHLGDKLEAAHCLREGGFYKEAIPIYEQKKQYETAAELYMQLGDEEEARRHYRLAVSRALAHGQHARAAVVLENHLEVPDEAIQILQSAWPRTNEAALCLGQELDLYQRHQDVARAQSRLEEVTEDHPPAKALALMDVLVRVARQSSEEALRNTAERCAYRVAGRWLGSPNFAETTRLLGLVRRLAPEDRLLVRDTARFAQQLAQERKEDETRRRLASREELPIQLVTDFLMPNWVTWEQTAARGDRGFYALGHNAQGNTLMRFDWEGNYQTHLLPASIPQRLLSRIRLTVAADSRPEIVSPLGALELPSSTLAAVDTFGNQAIIENPPWTSDAEFLGMTYSPSGVAWVVRREQTADQLVLLSYSSLGELIATHTLRAPIAGDGTHEPAPVPMVYAREQIIFLYHDHLIRFYRDRVDTLSLPHASQSIYHSSSGNLRLALPNDAGAEILWGDSQWGRRQALDLPVHQPKIAFTLTGNILALSSGRLDILEWQRNTYVPTDGITLEHCEHPLGLFPTGTTNLYAAVSASRVQLIQIQLKRRRA